MPETATGVVMRPLLVVLLTTAITEPATAGEQKVNKC